MLDDARGGPDQADETKTAKDAFCAELPGQPLLVAEPVLQGQEHGPLPQKRRDELGQGRVGRGFQGHQHEIHRADPGRGRVGVDIIQLEIAGAAPDGQSLTAHRFEVAPHQKMNLGPGLDEARAVVTADRARSHHRHAPRRHQSGGRLSAWKFRVIRRAPLLKLK